MTSREVAAALSEIEQGCPRYDAYTRLAWRPAWSIRSRRGAWAAFVQMLLGRC